MYLSFGQIQNNLVYCQFKKGNVKKLSVGAMLLMIAVNAMNSKQLHSLKFPSILFETISTFLELNHPMGRRKLRCFWLPLALTKKREKWACDVSRVYWSNLVAYSLPIRHHLSYISHILDWEYQEYIDDNISLTRIFYLWWLDT